MEIDKTRKAAVPTPPDDLYAVLGVSPAASRAEIIRAYRRLVRELHPDARPGDPAAAERFSSVTAAYEILRDPRRRAAYDQSRRSPGRRGQAIPVTVITGPGGPFGTDFPGRAPFGGGVWGGGLFSTPLRAPSAPTAPGRPRRSRRGTEVTVELADAVHGGEVVVADPTGTPRRVRIPPGVRDGETLRVRDDRAEDDLYLTVRGRPHPTYGRSRDDLTTTVVISFPEAVLGASVTLPALRGDRPVVTIPPRTRSGTVVRLPGGGVSRHSRAGDLLVTVLIDVPEVLTTEAHAAVEALAVLLPDPRSKGDAQADAP